MNQSSPTITNSQLKEGYKQAEVGVIPEDWQIKSLSKITSEIGDGIHSTPIYSNNGEYYFINGNNIQNGYICLTKETKQSDLSEFNKYKKNLNSRTILLSINGTIGNVAFYANEKIFLGKSAAYLNVEGSFSKRFTYYCLQTETVKRFFTDGLTGTTIKNLGLGTIRNTPIAIPPTKAEQEAIACTLSDIDALIESLDRLLTKKRQIKQGAMQELLRSKDGWIEKKLGKTATLKARIGWQGLTTAEYLDLGDFHLVTGTEFKNGFIDWNNCHFVEESRYKQDKNIQLKVDDVLVTKDGTIGKVAIVDCLKNPATLNSGVFVIRSVDNSFHPKFFYYLLCSNLFNEFLIQLSAGSTINHLYQKDFINFVYQVPKTLEEQIEIANILSDMDAEIGSIYAKLAKTRQLKQGMMHELLTGRIRLVDKLK
jgi:type I restriction enzyme, S subunit